MEVEMNRQDLLELYQLAVMYTRCYGLELGELRNNGMTLRGIAGTLQCSTGNVQDVLKQWEG